MTSAYLKHAASVVLLSALPLSYGLNLPRQSGGIRWGDCAQWGGPSDSRLSCGFLDVPLDWNDASKGNGRIAVAKFEAPGQKVGTLFTNPGGPGASGVENVLTGGDLLANFSGGIYDVVSWDPRGVGALTQPGEVSCFDDWNEYADFFDGTLIYPQFDVRGNFTDENDISRFMELGPRMDLAFADFETQCARKRTGQFMQYIGTAATVRDMVALADVLEPGTNEINYWGFSYGTQLGNTFVNMFPDRVGRVILDGNMDPNTYSMGRPDMGWAGDVESTDEAFHGFVNGCEAAGADACILADPEVSGDMDLVTWAQNLTEWAYEAHKEAPLRFYSASDVRNTIFQMMYTPTSWGDYANGVLFDLWESFAEPDSFSDDRKRELKLPPPPRIGHPLIKRQSSSSFPSQTLEAITCGDAPDLTDVTTEQVLDEILRVTRDVSGFFGPLVPQPSHYCHLWPMRAVERFQGPFNNTLSNQILIIGNKADPITPFRNAEIVSDLLGDSATLVQQDGFGHCSVAERSTCMARIIQDYFVNGNLPSGDDTVCKVDWTPDALFTGNFADPSTGVPPSGIEGTDSGKGGSDGSDSAMGITALPMASVTGLALLLGALMS